MSVIGVLRLYDPGTETWFGPGREHAAEAETRASEEARARREAEAELAKLRAALERLEATE